MRRGQLFLLSIAIVPMLATCSSLPKTNVNNQNVTVIVAPANVTLTTFGKQAFTQTVAGTSNTAVTWQVNSVTGGSVATGTISSSGAYSAPHSISTSILPADKSKPVTVTIKAISEANAAATGTATITLLTQGQAAQTGAIELGTSGSNLHASSTSGNTISCCGGTLGALVLRNGTNYILSNNHVLANSDSGAIGDQIIQPGLIDNPAINPTCQSTGTTTVANLSQFFTLEGNPPNPVDAAIAQIVSGQVDASGNILLLGATADANGVPIAGPPQAGSGVIANVGTLVAKSGRSSGLTCSTIETTPATFSVVYAKTCGGSTSFTVMYSNQVGVSGGDFSQEGDSGALIVTQSTADPVALLFAGSDTDTVGNPIQEVLLAMADQSNRVPTIVGGAAHQVIGCTLPGPSSAQKTAASVSVSDTEMQSAIAARDTHADKLLAISGVLGVGVGPSLDYSGKAAVVIFVRPGTAHTTLPVQLDGVRTRIVETTSEFARGKLNSENTQSFAPEQPTFQVTSLPAAEIVRAKAAHSANVAAWMQQPDVQGFGVASSVDSPGEAALMIFLIRGAAHNSIPPVIDGVRTRVRESSRFHAGLDGLRPGRGCSVPIQKNAAPGPAPIVQYKKTND
jgi:hypothetical protein